MWNVDSLSILWMIMCVLLMQPPVSLVQIPCKEPYPTCSIHRIVSNTWPKTCQELWIHVPCTSIWVWKDMEGGKMTSLCPGSSSAPSRAGRPEEAGIDQQSGDSLTNEEDATVLRFWANTGGCLQEDSRSRGAEEPPGSVGWAGTGGRATGGRGKRTLLFQIGKLWISPTKIWGFNMI